ncbi:hypothetical protein LAUMK42_04757 [Mycobacterium persicum]|uniref:Uncharacterized protein n=1 Tax=Mycobacterium persicum TaxID=1487726 RepID=A0AB38UZS3_9MYCO|nr:hypothetical protein LAUMK42_04757 [Mycobacterium persicum]
MLTWRAGMLTRRAAAPRPGPDILRRGRKRRAGVGGSYRATQRACRQRHANGAENTGRYDTDLRHSEHLSRLAETSLTTTLRASTLKRP